MCGYIAVVLFCTRRSTDRSISTLLYVVILQWCSSIQQEALIEVYLHCCVWLYCSGVLLYTTRSTDRSISTLLCVVVLQWCSSIYNKKH